MSVKPHASPVLHAINYLLGRLDRGYLTTLRQFGGLQSYPSPHEGPRPGRLLDRLGRPRRDRADLGRARAPLRRRALRRAGRRAPDRADRRRRARRGRLLGGDRRPDGEQARRGHVGRRPQPPVARPRRARHRRRPARRDVRGRRLALRDGQVRPAARRATELRERIDAMPNEEYQRLLRADAAELRERLEVDTGDLDDAELLRTFRDLGGHDLGALIDGYRQADAVRDRPSVVFAYTIKGWTLPTEGHPANHSALLNAEQYARARRARSAPTRRTRGRRSTRARRRPSCARRPRGGWTRASRSSSRRPPPVPADLGPRAQGHGVHPAGVRALLRRPRARGARGGRARRHRLARRRHLDQPRRLDQQGRHLVVGDRIDWFADDTDTLVRWRESDHGRHIELGIAEVNLVGLLGELGATWSRDGQPLLPVGTIYDPFVSRALEPWSFGIYAGGQSILVGTPSGVTLGPEGGAHQSVITPSIGIEQPGCVPGSRPSARTSSGRCCTRCRGSAARAASRRTSGSRRGRSTSRCTPARARRCSRGGYRLRAAPRPAAS